MSPNKVAKENKDLSGKLLASGIMDATFNYFTCCRYLICSSYAHIVASKGKYIAFVTTEAETENPEVELKPGIDLLRPVEQMFIDTYERFVPTNNHEADNCFISAVSSHACILCSYALMHIAAYS